MNLYIKIASYLSIYFIYFYLVQLNNASIEYLGDEDGIIESIGAFAFLITSVIFLYLFFRSSNDTNTFFGKPVKRNIYFGLLGLLFFLGVGEEISWGQRIFGWETSEYIKTINIQEETNLHNMWLFDSFNKDGSDRTFVQLLLNTDRLFIMFWFSFCILVPIMYKSSNKAKELIKFVGIPIVPLWIGGLFLFNLLIQQQYKYTFMKADTMNEIAREISETKESLFALTFLLVAIYFLNKISSTKQIGTITT